MPPPGERTTLRTLPHPTPKEAARGRRVVRGRGVSGRVEPPDRLPGPRRLAGPQRRAELPGRRLARLAARRGRVLRAVRVAVRRSGGHARCPVLRLPGRPPRGGRVAVAGPDGGRPGRGRPRRLRPLRRHDERHHARRLGVRDAGRRRRIDQLPTPRGTRGRKDAAASALRRAAGAAAGRTADDARPRPADGPRKRRRAAPRQQEPGQGRRGRRSGQPTAVRDDGRAEAVARRPHRERRPGRHRVREGRQGTRRRRSRRPAAGHRPLLRPHESRARSSRCS